MLYDKFILQLESPGDDEDEDEEDDDDEDDDKEMIDYEDSETVDDDEQGMEEMSSSGKRSAPSSPQSSHSTVQTVPSPSASPKKDGAAVKFDEDHAMLESEDLCPPSNEVILENKRKNPTLGRLFRSKGEFFLATRPNRAGDWSQAGAMLTMTSGRPWFCTLPPEEYTTGDEEVDGLVQHDIKMGGEWGDRRQELVFIGERLDNQALESMLDECLLTDSEYTKWEKTMRNVKLGDSEKRDVLEELFEDGFPDWTGDDEDDHEGHDHAHPTNLRSIKNQLQQEA